MNSHRTATRPLSWEEARDLARQRLTQLASAAQGIEDWRSYLLTYQPHAEHPDDAYAWLTCALALEAVAQGNFGVGAVLVDEAGHVLAQGHNEVFHPYFRSDRHAEMVVLDGWEDAHPEPPGPEPLTLYTSLEPCPMCLVRLSTSAVRKVFHVALDPPGGMVQRMEALPPFWAGLAEGKTFGPARCSPDLTRAADQLFLLNLQELTARIKARALPLETPESRC